MTELLVIFVVALLFLGPEKLPDAAKKLSQGIRDFRQHGRELQRTLDEDTELGSAVRDLKSALRGDELRTAVAHYEHPKESVARPDSSPDEDDEPVERETSRGPADTPPGEEADSTRLAHEKPDPYDLRGAAVRAAAAESTEKAAATETERDGSASSRPAPIGKGNSKPNG